MVDSTVWYLFNWEQRDEYYIGETYVSYDMFVCCLDHIESLHHRFYAYD